MVQREPKQQQSVQHKCPGCGASLAYDPASGKLHCDHCNTFVDFEKFDNVSERSFDELATFHYWKDSDIASYRCSNCGAVVVAPRTMLATTCPYCNSPVVIVDKTGALVKPDSLVPFELTQKQAAAQLSVWRKSKLFAPRKFRKHVTEDCIKGVFVPAWTFDADTTSTYDGTVGYNRTRTVRRNGKIYTETYVEWQHIHGTIDVSFDDIFVRANDNLSPSEFSKLQPFPQSKYKVFDDEYLAGYIADHYTVEPQEAFSQAREQMQREIRQRILSRYHADVEGIVNVKTNLNSRSFKYMFLPVYVASTKYNNKYYNQYVSGIFSDDQRLKSKVCGKAPVSAGKIVATVLSVLVAIIGFALLFANLG